MRDLGFNTPLKAETRSWILGRINQDFWRAELSVEGGLREICLLAKQEDKEAVLA